MRAGLRSADACAVRRGQSLLASAQGLRPPQTARDLACAVGTVHDAPRACARAGPACLQAKPSRPQTVRPYLGPEHADALNDLLHHRPRLFGQPAGVWALPRVAPVGSAKGWTPRPLSGAAIRQALQRLGIRWRRAKHWITPPGPAYARKKTPAAG